VYINGVLQMEGNSTYTPDATGVGSLAFSLPAGGDPGKQTLLLPRGIFRFLLITTPPPFWFCTPFINKKNTFLQFVPLNILVCSTF
jgi:hypothetical protein